MIKSPQFRHNREVQARFRRESRRERKAIGLIFYVLFFVVAFIIMLDYKGF